MPAGQPTRSSGSMTVGWGIISLPLSLYSGTEEGGIRRQEFVAVQEGDETVYHKVGRQSVDKQTGQEVAYQDVVKMYETSSGAFIPLSDQEIETVISPDRQGKVVAFLPLAHLAVGTYLPDAMYQARPSKGSGRDRRPDPRAEQAFALLMAAMEAEKVFGLIEMVLRGKPRYAALCPDGRLLILHFDDEVRSDLAMPEAQFSKQELTMGRRFVKQLMRDEAPVLTDTASAKVRDYAEAKAAGTATAPVMVETIPSAMPDLMAALEASLAQAQGERAAS